MEERSNSGNVIAAVILSAVVLLAWDYFFAPKPQPLPLETEIGQINNNLPSNASDTNINSASSITKAFKNIETVLDGKNNRLLIDTKAITGSIDLETGRFDDLILKRYDNTLNSDSKIRLLAPANTEHGFYAELDYIAENNTQDAKKNNWQVVSGDLNKSDNNVILKKMIGTFEITRTISLDDNYMFTISDSILNTSDKPIDITPYGLVREYDPAFKHTEKSYVVHTGFVGYLNGSAKQIAFDDLKEDTYKDNSLEESKGGWVGLTDKYWATILIPNNNEAINVRAIYNPYGGHDAYQADYTLKTRSIKAGESITLNNRLFAGAKSVTLINQYQDNLNIQGFDFLIDWGWFWFFTRPIFKGLLYLYSLVGNYGTAILLLTLALKLLFFPLANKSYVAMSHMKRLQPEMEKIREKHADNPMEQQQALVALYKREKINPVAGCWPMLLQIPVFFALYKVLNVALELRHQPFFGWIQDLSAPDPTNMFTLFGLIPLDMPVFLHIGIWPLLMGVTMWMQQRLNPAPNDPIQAKMMSLFPIMFTFILAPFAAGLVIYWTWNNILSIIQQTLIMKRLGVPIEFRLWKKQDDDKSPAKIS